METATLRNQQINQQMLFPFPETSLRPIQITSQTEEYKQAIREALRVSLPVLRKEEPEDKEITEARKILGEAGQQFSAAEIKDIVTEVQYLVDSWLDDCERQIFNGSTLKEVLHERGKL